MDLGRKPLSPTEPATPEAPKVTYPSFTLNDDVAEAFEQAHPDLKMGEEISVTVKLKVTRKQNDQFGSSIGFDVVSLDGLDEGAGGKDEQKPEEGSKTVSPEEEESILGFKRPEAKKTPPPFATGAKELL